MSPAAATPRRHLAVCWVAAAGWLWLGLYACHSALINPPSYLSISLIPSTPACLPQIRLVISSGSSGLFIIQQQSSVPASIPQTSSITATPGNIPRLEASPREDDILVTEGAARMFEHGKIQSRWELEAVRWANSVKRTPSSPPSGRLGVSSLQPAIRSSRGGGGAPARRSQPTVRQAKPSKPDWSLPL